MSDNIYELNFDPDSQKLIFAPTKERVLDWSVIISTKRYSLEDVELFQVTALETDFPELTIEEQKEFCPQKLVYLIVIHFDGERFMRIPDHKLYHNILGLTLHGLGFDNPGWIGIGKIVSEDTYPNQSVIMG